MPRNSLIAANVKKNLPSTCCVRKIVPRCLNIVTILFLVAISNATLPSETLLGQTLHWQRLDDLPEPLGVAGPIVGVHEETLMIAGGANFSRPVWDNPKRWHRGIYTLKLTDSEPRWRLASALPRKLGYAACVSTPAGVFAMGGNDDTETFAACYCLRFQPGETDVEVISLPPLPEPCVYAQACCIGDWVYVCCGQKSSELSSATARVLALKLVWDRFPEGLKWQVLPDFPGGARAFHACATLPGTRGSQMHLIGGRRQSGSQVEFLKDHWVFDPASMSWKELDELPNPVSAGVAVGDGLQRLFLLGWDDGRLFDKTDQLRDQHPGFPREALVYDTETRTWSRCPTPQNQLTTTAVLWRDRLILPTGEIRPRVRTPNVWLVDFEP